MRPNKDLERIQEKWVPVFRPNARPNKDLERFRDSVKFGNALGPPRPSPGHAFPECAVIFESCNAPGGKGRPGNENGLFK